MPHDTSATAIRIAIVWRADRAARAAATASNSRYVRVFEALAALGVAAEPAVYAEDCLAEVQRQLQGVDGVLVWVDPLSAGRSRADLDALLRRLGERGVWLGAHPDVIAAMGCKEVLHRTRDLGWGSDVALYESADDLAARLPARLSIPRVLKRSRGNGGQGVWKAEWAEAPGGRLRVREALQTAVDEILPLAGFIDRCRPYFAGGGRMVDQPFLPRVGEGMVRAYMAGDVLVGFSRHLPRGLLDATPADDGATFEKTLSGPEAPTLQDLRRRMEGEWTPALQRVLRLAASDLPAIWDADFLRGDDGPAGEPRWVLCEINASCVFPIPDAAPDAIARRALAGAAAARQARRTS